MSTDAQPFAATEPVDKVTVATASDDPPPLIEPTPLAERQELVIALVGAIGSDFKRPLLELEAILKIYGYETREIVLSDVIRDVYNRPRAANERFADRRALIRGGDDICEVLKDEAALVDAAIARLRKERPSRADPASPKKLCFVLRSLKRPQEIERLRGVYGGMFYAIGVFADKAERTLRLTRELAEDGNEQDAVARREAEQLVAIDENERSRWGQKVSDTFAQVDYIIRSDAQDDVREALERFVPLVFGKPHITPTIGEVAMMHAYAAGIRSADLSRQIGAVIVARDGRILVTGCNEVPRGGGGQYWESDIDDRRDFKTGRDLNDRKKRDAIVEMIARMRMLFREELALELPADIYRRMLKEDIFSGTTVDSLIEFGRVSHAEMSAITSATLQGVALRDGDLYTTTFPCHMCTRLIIACGMRNVFYIEPYPKSAAMQLYGDGEVVVNPVLTPSQRRARLFDAEVPDKRTHLMPFDGVAPRRYTELFSKARSKDKQEGSVLDFVPLLAKPRRTPEFTVMYGAAEDYLAHRWERQLDTLRRKAKPRAAEERPA